VVVVCLDTLRADHLGSAGHPGGLTPNLDRLAAESIRYEQAFAQANETILSHASLFTSRYPSEVAPFRTPASGAGGLPQGTPTLAGRLHAAGWETAAVVAGGHLSRAYGLSSGFDHYDDTLDWGSLSDTGPRAIQWLDQRSAAQPFFLFVHGYDTHDRYLKPTPFGYSRADVDHFGQGRELGRQPGAVSQVADGVWADSAEELVVWARDRPRFDRGAGAAQLDSARPLTPADLQHLGQLYAGSVAWADASLGLFLGDLESRGLLDDIWLVVLSDHGHELGQHGSFHHRFALNDDTLHVPLLIRPPGGLDSGRVEKGLVDLLDIAPSVLEVAGAAADPGARGQSLLVSGQPQSPDRRHTFAEGRLRLLSVRDGTGGRLTAEGLSIDHPMLAQLLRDTPPVTG
jgi:arylsulfatase